MKNMSENVSKEFVALSREVAKSGKPHSITVRDLLRHFGQERRGSEVVRFINYKLRYLGLDTEPPFEEVHIDSSVQLIPRPKRPRGRPPKSILATPPNLNVIPTVPVHSAPEIVTVQASDEQLEAPREAVLRIGLLESAIRKPYSVRSNDPLEMAITLLMMHDITHIPVMQSERMVEGIITWRSIGRTKAANRQTARAQDCMETVPRIVPLDAPLFDTVRNVIQEGVVLVQARDKTICGIVTSWDIAHQFVNLSEPFLYLEQIENHLRHLLGKAKLRTGELKALVDPADSERQTRTRTVDDLTFSEYLRGLGMPDYWERLKLGIDRQLFVAQLDSIRKIRNAVMHFHPDGITKESREVLARTRAMLQGL